jgi:hypothetical protein
MTKSERTALSYMYSEFINRREKAQQVYDTLCKLTDEEGYRGVNTINYMQGVIDSYKTTIEYLSNLLR